VTLGGLTRVEEEPSHGPPVPRMRMMAAGAMAEDGPTEVTAGDLTVSRQIRAWFEIA
jgi:hypothetical protein